MAIVLSPPLVSSTKTQQLLLLPPLLPPPHIPPQVLTILITIEPKGRRTGRPYLAPPPSAGGLSCR